MGLMRRQIIIGAGGLALVGSGGLAWTVTRVPETATKPWNVDPAPLADVRLDAFRYAILAPNPHNRQPWRIALEGETAAILTCDLAKRLPQTDPFDRQTMIGFGTFIELARIAGAERGFRLDATPFPDGEPQPRLDARPIARLTFIKDAAVPRDPLFAAIVKRRSNKEAYEDGTVNATLAAKIADGAGFTIDPAAIAPIRGTVLKAIRLEQMLPRTHKESVDLIRIGAREVEANPDGIDLSGPMIETLRLGGMISRVQLADPASTAFQSGLEMMDATYGSIPALIWIVTPGNSRADQLEAGRLYVRANLRAAALGLAMHPMSQALQEYPEMAPHFEAVHALCGATGEARVQMLARIGYAPPTAPSPRRPLESHIDA